MRKRYVERLTMTVQSDFPEILHELSTSKLRNLVFRAMARAEQAGIRKESDLTFYIRLLGALGPDFSIDPAHTWIGEILASDELDGTEKVDLIHDNLVFVWSNFEFSGNDKPTTR